MAKYSVYKRTVAAGTIEFNMTPMIDCTFQLILFFILASQVASEALAKLDLPRPETSQAIPSEETETPNRVIVNVISAAEDGGGNPALADKAKRYEINRNAIQVGDIERLVDIFHDRMQGLSKPEDFYVEIRADYHVGFGEVQPIMLACAEAGIVNLYLTALTAVGE